MARRHPSKGFENGLTAAPYAVFHGFSDIFEDFPDWATKPTPVAASMITCSKERVQFYGGQSGYAGALSDSADTS